MQFEREREMCHWNSELCPICLYEYTPVGEFGNHISKLQA
uniref:Uncharacterized protein n=1 Tax=Anguilla anguilla TaxID=7936 RepID=A0A0E9SNT1_ANGAN